MSNIKDNWNLIEEKIIKTMYQDGYFPLTLADEVVRKLREPTATEFLDKLMAICKSEGDCMDCPMSWWCGRPYKADSVEDIISDVKKYEIGDGEV